MEQGNQFDSLIPPTITLSIVSYFFTDTFVLLIKTMNYGGILLGLKKKLCEPRPRSFKGISIFD
jgi:hypothetical protein